MFKVNMVILLLFTILGMFTIPIFEIDVSFANKDESLDPKRDKQRAIVKDPNLKIELVVRDLEFPTGMAFIGPDDILVLEKNEGIVKRVVNGQMLKDPLLDVNVGNDIERGMLGITISRIYKDNNESAVRYVFLYFTETKLKDGEDVTEGIEPLGNRVYRYELEDDKLVRPELLLDLPAKSEQFHNGGKIVFGSDNNLYIAIGDFFGKNTTVENFMNGSEPDGTSGILRITQDGEPVGDGILGNTFPLNLYYAYGVRNSFGIDFDPVTGKLWDTENGPDYGDEINLVEPGFNSGWSIVQGFWKYENDSKGDLGLTDSNFVTFNGSGIYSGPEFVWEFSVGPTALKFLNSDKLGKEYENDMFVGDFHNGNIYHFDLEKNRTDLILENELDDKIAHDKVELETTIFASGLGGITDMQIGPDGYLYILSLFIGGHHCDSNGNSCISYSSEKGASIMRIVPAFEKTQNNFS